ncbi:MAG: hypothetical protein ACLSGS_04480 [Adlercreutzia sp.]
MTTDLAVGDIAALAQQFQGDEELTIYSAMVPSTTAMIGDVSYVINDPVATKEMMKLVEAGEDPSSVVSSGYVDPGDTAGGASTYGNGYGSTGSGAGNGAGNAKYDDPGYTDASGTGELTTAAMLTTVTLTTPVERWNRRETTSYCRRRGRYRRQADTTSAILIRALRRTHREPASRWDSRTAQAASASIDAALIGSTGRLSRPPVELFCGYCDHRLQRRMGPQRHERRTQSRT